MDIKPYILKFWNFWPPFFFSGIRVDSISKDYKEIHASLKLRFYNSNYVGTQFGGLIFTLTDPFYMIMLIKNLGSDYSVWDKAAEIQYIKPGRTDLYADFIITDEELEAITRTVKENGKMLFKKFIAIKDLNGVTIAEVNKTIYISLKSKQPRS